MSNWYLNSTGSTEPVRPRLNGFTATLSTCSSPSELELEELSSDDNEALEVQLDDEGSSDIDDDTSLAALSLDGLSLVELPLVGLSLVALPLEGLPLAGLADGDALASDEPLAGASELHDVALADENC